MLSVSLCASLTYWRHHNRSDSGHSETAGTTGAAVLSAVTSGTAPPHHYCHLSSSPSSLPKYNTDQPGSNADGEPAQHEESVGLLGAWYVAYTLFSVSVIYMTFIGGLFRNSFPLNVTLN
jgi:hypothetical protein